MRIDTAGLAVGSPTVRSVRTWKGKLLDAGLEPRRQRLHARRRTVDDRRPPWRTTHSTRDDLTCIYVRNAEAPPRTVRAYPTAARPRSRVA